MNKERFVPNYDWLIEVGGNWPKDESNEDVSASAAQAHNATGADALGYAKPDLPAQPDSATDESEDHKNQGQSSQNQLDPSL